MRHFNYEKAAGEYLSDEIVSLLTKIYEHKGRLDVILGIKGEELSKLCAKVMEDDIEASNVIKGLYVSPLGEKRTRISDEAFKNEKDGYAKAARRVLTEYEDIVISPDEIKRIHRDIYAFVKNSNGGKYKTNENYIAEASGYGNNYMRIFPAGDFNTTKAIEEMCESFNRAWDNDKVEKLIIIPMFVMDILCVYPFEDGNGRVSRLLSTMLKFKAGFLAGKYVSTESLTKETDDDYFEAFRVSSADWHDEINDYTLFIKYHLNNLLNAFENFDKKISVSEAKKQPSSKTDKIKAFINEHNGEIKKGDIVRAFPETSKITIERTLAALLKEGFLEKLGAGPATAYRKKL